MLVPGLHIVWYHQTGKPMDVAQTASKVRFNNHIYYLEIFHVCDDYKKKRSEGKEEKVSEAANDIK